MDPSNDINSELETFRERWRAEVQARNPPTGQQRQANNTSEPSSSFSRPQRSTAPAPQLASAQRAATLDNDDDYVPPRSFDDLDQTGTPSRSNQGEIGSTDVRDPVSALDHYEQAVEKEAQGSLGDSLRLYRKAFRVCWLASPNVTASTDST